MVLLVTAALLAGASSARAVITLTNLFSFGAGYTNSDGLNPSGGLVQGKDGSFYGVTPDGGPTGAGTV